MDTPRDAHGQPLNRLLRARQNVDRSIDELIGLCKGITADGVVNQREAECLCAWLAANEHVRDTWPANVLRARVAEYLEDGYLDDDEKAELLDMLSHVSARREACAPVNLSTSLPFDAPLPRLVFHGGIYCLTGKFHTGSRRECGQFIESLGGSLAERPRKTGCVLVVGEIGSRDWIHSTHGRKIEEAVVFRSQGLPVCIVPEYHWFESLRQELHLA